MKDDDTLNDSLLGDVIAQLRHLGEMQVEERAKSARDGGGKAPASQENPPKTPRDELVERMVEERRSKNGIVTREERAAIEHYVDSKVADIGPGATVSDLSPSEQDQMVGYIRNIDEDMLYKREGGERITVGPVQRANKSVPFLTTPDYPQEPGPKPVDPHPGYKATLSNKPMPPEKPNTLFCSAATTARKMAEYEEAVREYEEALRVWNEDDKYQEEEWKYDEDNKAWRDECKSLDKSANNVEKALALGVMRTDYNPETGRYTLAFMDANGNWQSKECRTAEEVKTRAYRAVNENLVNPNVMRTVVTGDLLAAISTGDVVVHPNLDGSALEVTTYQRTEKDGDGNPKIKPGSGRPKLFPTGEILSSADIAAIVAGYQDAAGVKYEEIDGRAYRNLDERNNLVLNNATTVDADGNRICSICGNPWPQEKGRDFNRGLPVAPRSGEIMLRKIQYHSGYDSWEKVDSAARLAKAVLSAVGDRRLAEGQVGRIVEYTRSIIGGKPDLLERFRSSLSHFCSGSPSVLQDNVHAIVDRLSSPRGNRSMHARINGKCPLCGQALPTPDKVLNMEIQKAGTVFKGDERTNAEAEKAFNGVPYVVASGVAELLRDGTQQAFNPFIDEKATWTKFSYRPTDSKEAYPIISIVPASFQGMANINTVLNSTPYVFVKEYFMRNNISSSLNLFQSVLEGKADAPSVTEANEAEAVRDNTMELTEVVKNAFIDLKDPFEQVIDMPYVLYHRLKAKMYGNQYVFPYNPKDFALATSSNTEEWGGKGILSSLVGGLLNAVNGVSGFLGFGIANPFPAPTWALPESGTKWNMTFDLNLINDEFVRTRNNYMCANTLINNNRWIQKTILGFPGALYELLIPTGLRELMCTGTFTLKPLGVNRHVPHDFFDVPFKIGARVFAGGKEDMHSSAYEVVPDAYALNCSFQSAISENLNNSIFAYYLKITDFAPGTPVDGAFKAGEEFAPWSTAAVASVTTDDVVALENAVETVANTVEVLVGDQGEKAAAEDAKNQAEAARVSPPPANSSTPPPAPSSSPAPVRRRDVLRSDEATEAYERQYNNLRQRLSIIRSDISANRMKLRELMERSESLPLTKIRKAYSKRISKVNAEFNELVRRERQTEDSLIQVEMMVLMHAKDAVEERANSDILVVPRGYFDPYQLDEVTALKIRLMTRDELDRFIAEKEEHMKAVDEWGIHNCRDFWIRAGAIRFIGDAMKELEDLIRDSYETDSEAHDKYRYRYEMLKDDLRAALDPSKPFILNRTNIIYIPPENLPDGLRPESESEGDASVEEQPGQDETGSSEELVETDGGEGNLPAVVPLDDGSLVVDRTELIRRHRADVVRHVFGNEENLAAEAFRVAIERYPAARFDRDALVMLKNDPSLDGETDMTGWFGRQEGEMYASVHERMVEREDESVAIYPKDPSFDIHSVNRAGAIFYITQDLYRYVSMCRTVVLGNAMDTVKTKSTAVLNRVTQRFQRLEN